MSEQGPLTRERILRTAMELADEQGPGSADDAGPWRGAWTANPWRFITTCGARRRSSTAWWTWSSPRSRTPPRKEWREEMSARCHSARSVLGKHPWVIALMESRTNPGPATIKHHDAVIGNASTRGFSVALTAHAYALIDSYLYGFAVQEAGLPGEADAVDELAEELMAALPVEQYPHFVELTVEHVLQPGYDFADEFDFGLSLILDGLDARLGTLGPGTPRKR